MKDIIDLHCHYNHNTPKDTVTNELYKADLDFLKEERAYYGINATAFSSFYSVLSTENIYEENASLADLAAKEDWIYQWFVLDPRQPKLFMQANEILKTKKCLGIKIINTQHGYPICEYADEIFSFANEKGCFVLMHPDCILDMPTFTDKYPKMKLIIAHLGSLEHIQAVKQAKHGNIYLDTSGVASSKNNIIEYAIQEIGSEKIFFGTDTYSCAFQKGRIDYARISDNDKENILRNNAHREFIAFKDGK